MTHIEITHVVNFKRELEKFKDIKQNRKQMGWSEIPIEDYLLQLIVDAFFHIYRHNEYEAKIYKIRFENVDAVGKEKIKSIIDGFFNERTPRNDEDEVELKRVYDLMMDETEILTNKTRILRGNNI